MPRGEKLCPTCNKYIPAACKKCPECKTYILMSVAEQRVHTIKLNAADVNDPAMSIDFHAPGLAKQTTGDFLNFRPGVINPMVIGGGNRMHAASSSTPERATPVLFSPSLPSTFTGLTTTTNRGGMHESATSSTSHSEVRNLQWLQQQLSNVRREQNAATSAQSAIEEQQQRLRELHISGGSFLEQLRTSKNGTVPVAHSSTSNTLNVFSMPSTSSSINIFPGAYAVSSLPSIMQQQQQQPLYAASSSATLNPTLSTYTGGVNSTHSTSTMPQAFIFNPVSHQQLFNTQQQQQQERERQQVPDPPQLLPQLSMPESTPLPLSVQQAVEALMALQQQQQHQHQQHHQIAKPLQDVSLPLQPAAAPPPTSFLSMMPADILLQLKLNSITNSAASDITSTIGPAATVVAESGSANINVMLQRQNDDINVHQQHGLLATHYSRSNLDTAATAISNVGVSTAAATQAQPHFVPALLDDEIDRKEKMREEEVSDSRTARTNAALLQFFQRGIFNTASNSTSNTSGNIEQQASISAMLSAAMANLNASSGLSFARPSSSASIAEVAPPGLSLLPADAGSSSLMLNTAASGGIADELPMDEAADVMPAPWTRASPIILQHQQQQEHQPMPLWVGSSLLQQDQLQQQQQQHQQRQQQALDEMKLDPVMVEALVLLQQRCPEKARQVLDVLLPVCTTAAVTPASSEVHVTGGSTSSSSRRHPYPHQQQSTNIRIPTTTTSASVHTAARSPSYDASVEDDILMITADDNSIMPNTNTKKVRRSSSKSLADAQLSANVVRQDVSVQNILSARNLSLNAIEPKLSLQQRDEDVRLPGGSNRAFTQFKHHMPVRLKRCPECAGLIGKDSKSCPECLAKHTRRQHHHQQQQLGPEPTTSSRMRHPPASFPPTTVMTVLVSETSSEMPPPAVPPTTPDGVGRLHHSRKSSPLPHGTIRHQQVSFHPLVSAPPAVKRRRSPPEDDRAAEDAERQRALQSSVSVPPGQHLSPSPSTTSSTTAASSHPSRLLSRSAHDASLVHMTPSTGESTQLSVPAGANSQEAPSTGESAASEGEEMHKRPKFNTETSPQPTARVIWPRIPSAPVGYDSDGDKTISTGSSASTLVGGSSTEQMPQASKAEADECRAVAVAVERSISMESTSTGSPQVQHFKSQQSLIEKISSLKQHHSRTIERARSSGNYGTPPPTMATAAAGSTTLLLPRATTIDELLEQTPSRPSSSSSSNRGGAGSAADDILWLKVKSEPREIAAASAAVTHHTHSRLSKPLYNPSVKYTPVFPSNIVERTSRALDRRRAPHVSSFGQSSLLSSSSGLSTTRLAPLFQRPFGSNTTMLTHSRPQVAYLHTQASVSTSLPSSSSSSELLLLPQAEQPVKTIYSGGSMVALASVAEAASSASSGRRGGGGGGSQAILSSEALAEIMQSP